MALIGPTSTNATAAVSLEHKVTDERSLTVGAMKLCKAYGFPLI